MRALGRIRSVLVVVAVLGLAGCGSDDGAEPGASGTTRSVSPKDEGAVPDDLCSLITAADLSQALGATVTTEVGPSGDCEFDEEDPRGLSGSLGVIGFADTNGGFDGYVSGLDATLKNAEASDLDGLAGKAVIKVGTPSFGSGENLMAGGVVDRGSYLLQITLIQGNKLPAETLRTAVGNALRYVDSKLT